MRRAKAVDGEAFAIFSTKSRLTSSIKLGLKLADADQVTDPGADADNADGIKFDAEGNPVSHSILREHPGSGSYLSIGDVSPTPARTVIHWFSSDRPGQVRGVPDITSALPLFAQLRRYTLAVIAAAETAADFAAVVHTTANAAGEGDEVEPSLPIEIEQRAMLSLPSGWTMTQLRAEQPARNFCEVQSLFRLETAT